MSPRVLDPSPAGSDADSSSRSPLPTTAPTGRARLRVKPAGTETWTRAVAAPWLPPTLIKVSSAEAWTTSTENAWARASPGDQAAAAATAASASAIRPTGDIFYLRAAFGYRG